MKMPLKKPLNNESGSTMMELALSIPLLVLVLFGTMDLGRMFYTGITLSGAALAGAQYGAFSVANNTDFTGMQQAALNDSANITGVSATATSYCECLDGTTQAVGYVSSDLTVTTTWSPDNKAGSVVTVKVSYPYAPIGPYIPSATFALTSTSKLLIVQ